MTTRRVRTPSDFRRTLGFLSFARHEWIDPAPKVEPEVQRLLDEFFADLPCI